MYMYLYFFASLHALYQASLEVSVEDIYHPGSELDIPKRPPWSYSMSKAEVERQEEAMFESYLKNIYSKHDPQRLSFFEHNLEVSYLLLYIGKMLVL